MRHAPSRTTLLLAVLLAVLLLDYRRIVSVVSAVSPARTDIGTAVVATRTEGGYAARNTEKVRYSEDTLQLLASYRVADGRVVDASEADLAVWRKVQRVLPDDALVAIRQLNVVTDGAANTLAMVHRSTVDPRAWVLSVDRADLDDGLTATLVHEYAHLLSLDPAHLRAHGAAKTCSGRDLQIGCALAGSELGRFADRFWSGVPEPAAFDRARFVSEYAASSVHEDFAESFMTWVLGSTVRKGTVAAEKVAFFDGEPTYVAAKAAVRAKTSAAS